jgi:hypothetical protein
MPPCNPAHLGKRGQQPLAPLCGEDVLAADLMPFQDFQRYIKLPPRSVPPKAPQNPANRGGHADIQCE